MQEVPFTLENLRHLDLGKIGAAFNAEMLRVNRDCLDRPLDDKPRRVVITFLVVPAQSEGSSPGDTVEVGCEITSTVPKRRTRIYTMQTKANGMLTFHPDSPADPKADLLYDKQHIDTETGEVTE